MPSKIDIAQFHMAFGAKIHFLRTDFLSHGFTRRLSSWDAELQLIINNRSEILDSLSHIHSVTLQYFL